MVDVSIEKSPQMDLIKTIEEDADVQDFSEDSDAEVEVIIQKRIYVKCLCNMYQGLNC